MIETMLNFIFSKEAFSGIITLLAGSVAIVVYILHKRDEKMKAARIIIMEIRNAEQQITEIKNNEVISDFTSILPLNSWNKYNYLFVKELDRDDLDFINNFYRACSLAEEETQRLKSFLPITMTEKARVIQYKLLELSEKYKDDEDNENYSKHKEAILKRFHKEDYWFLPSLPKEKLVKYLQNIQYVSTSYCGEKFKKIAKSK